MTDPISENLTDSDLESVIINNPLILKDAYFHCRPIVFELTLFKERFLQALKSPRSRLATAGFGPTKCDRDVPTT